ncbi:adenosine deaminase [Modestobacter sp. URMC 112]
MIGLRMNLHTHLEGWVRPATARELAEAQGVPAPLQGWEAALTMPAAGSLTDYLAHVAAGYPVLGAADALARVTREAVEDAAADGTAFLELRAGPTTHVRPGLPLDAVVGAMCSGLAEGVRTTGMPAVLVLAVLREFDEEAALEVVESAVRHQDAGVVAVDLAGDEARYPDLTPFRAAFARARSAGLGVTAHAAEAADASAARQAHELLGVQRIGHGSRVVLDRDELAWAVANDVCFEVCPTSNVLTGAVTGLDAHPLKPMLAAGARVVLGDDDPVTTGAPLSHERRLVSEDMGLDRSQLMAMSAAALDVAFCSDDVRRSLRDADAA